MPAAPRDIKFVLCPKNSDEFLDGRSLAKDIYKKSWGTNKMGDDYDIGIVAYEQNEVIGNINIKLPDHKNKLPTDKYFIPGEIPEYAISNRRSMAELCGLSVSDQIKSEHRAYTLGGLIVGAHMAAYQSDITVFATAQRKPLISKLQNMYHYPFDHSVGADVSCENLPEDLYWQSNCKPNLYYIDLTSTKTIQSSMAILLKLSQFDINISNRLSLGEFINEKSQAMA
ncbi:MAG: hypothetical protein HLX50_00270 [Alteromonadaceae bacterium]|nr:hypothetical protein [Alteromonadaceae bacterium]